MAHRSGFVNIIGNPNVGKSTLMNQLVGEKLSIITSKAQTTRHRIMGIVNGDDFQIVYSDTPGILKPNYKLQEKMMKFVRGAITDADVLLYVTDTVEDSDRSAEIIEKVRLSQIPTIVVINKVDLTTPDKLTTLVEKWQALLPDAIIAPCSAKENFNVEGVFNLILERLPEGEPFYPKDTLTDKQTFLIANELIKISKFPFRNNTWLGPFHTINASEEFIKEFGFKYFIFDVLSEYDNSVVILKCIPIYESEYEAVCSTQTGSIDFLEKYSSIYFAIECVLENFDKLYLVKGISNTLNELNRLNNIFLLSYKNKNSPL